MDGVIQILIVYIKLFGDPHRVRTGPADPTVPDVRVHEERPRPRRQRILTARIRQGDRTHREVGPIDDREHAVADVTVLRLAELGAEHRRPRLVAVIDNLEEPDSQPHGEYVA